MYLQEFSAEKYQQKSTQRLELPSINSTRYIQLYKAQHLVLQQLLCYRPQFCHVQYHAYDIPQRTSSLEYSVLESADAQTQ